jgi:alpha-tubulin suppressor-like RCC1 family protein
MKRGWKKVLGWTLMISILSLNLAGMNAASASEEVAYPEIASGSSHSLAVKKDGTVWGWGNNDNYQLGNGTAERTHTPLQVPGLADVASVAAGSNFSAAVKKDGTIWIWGDNTYGQLGDGTQVSRKLPVQVKDPSDPTGYLTGVKQVALGQPMPTYPAS